MKTGVKETFLKSFFFLLMVLFLYSLIKRYIYGIGSISNLSDEMPWGLWKGLNIFGGVALAAGGFVITAIIYIFNLKMFRVLLKPLILMSFLGYLTVIVSLLIDDGRPWNIVMPLIFWNTKSVMWEVSWCVATYTLVLFLEFLPIVLEKLGFKKTINLWARFIPPLVFVGVILSTLHQSSLGTLLVIVPHKIHKFWYSQILPLLFFLSAIVLGLSTINLVICIYKNRLEKIKRERLSLSISNFIIVMFSFYLIVRAADIFWKSSLSDVFSFSFPSMLLLTEYLLFGIIPLFLLLLKKKEPQSSTFFLANLFIVLGVVLNRVNVSIIAFQMVNGAEYFPHFLEIVVSISIFLIPAYIFNIAVKKLPLFP